ncbi:hypothetical protein HPP92_013496 [Vanilla planifolia]|uniref:NET domain-containing protein n=1 Tax=Vanilla planifolia TaxID=51239 RepID=A0A835UYJ0_VANPL|nr:hypothetical protein HPP92_013496 [Vanilla planifolia]
MAELKWKREESDVLAQHKVKEMHKEIVCTLPVIQKETSLLSTSHSKKYLAPAEKLMLKKDIEKFPLCKMSSELLNFLRKNSLLRWIKNKVSIDIDKADGDTLWQLHEIMEASIDARTLKRIDKKTASPKHVIQKETPSSAHCVGQMTMAEKFRLKKCIKEAPSQRKPQKLLSSFKKSSQLGVNNDNACMKVDARRMKPVCGTNDEVNCKTQANCKKQHLAKGDGKSTAKYEYAIDKLQPGPLPSSKDLSDKKDCSHDSHSDFTLPTLANVESERSSCVENLVQNTKISDINSGEHDCNLNVVVHGDRRSSESDGEKVLETVVCDDFGIFLPTFLLNCEIFLQTPDIALCTIDAQLCGEQLSPSKALRIARLKSRYVDTILKAQHKCENHDQKRMQQEREILASKFQQEKEMIEAQIKLAEAAAEKQKSEHKMKIQQEREASCLTFAKDSAVMFNDLNKTLQELEKSCHSKENALRQLGLFLKDDELNDEDDWEEGEIHS